MSIYKGSQFIAGTPDLSEYAKTSEVTSSINNMISNKANTNLGNVSSNIDFVVESQVNGTNWCRVYRSGWCEQGGRGALNENSTTTITLSKPYKDTNYFVSAVSITESTATDTEAGLQCTPKSTTQITLTAHHLNPNNQTACWEAKGYKA